MIEFIATIICGCLSAAIGRLAPYLLGIDENGIAFWVVMLGVGAISVFPITKIGNIIVDAIYKFREKK